MRTIHYRAFAFGWAEITLVRRSLPVVLKMDAAKDLLKRAVELDSAQRYSEAIICYEEGIQNILRAIGGITYVTA